MNKRIEKMWVDGTGCSVPRKGKFASVGAVHIEKFAEILIRDVLAQVEEIQRLDQTLKKKVGIDFEIKVAYEVLKNYGLRSGYCACCGVPAGQPHDDSCVWS